DMSILRELASALARIPKRIGLGLGPQRLFITNRGIGQEHFHDHPIDWLRALMAETKVPLLSTEPDLPLPQAVSAAISEQFASCTRPWIVLGIGASHPDKDWSDAAWIRFLAGLQTPGTVFLIGGPANARRAAAFIAATGAERTINACGLRLIEAGGQLRLCGFVCVPKFRPAQSCRRRRHGCFRSVRFDHGPDLFEIHSRHCA